MRVWVHEGGHRAEGRSKAQKALAPGSSCPPCSAVSLLLFFHTALHSATAASAVLTPPVYVDPASPVGVCERRSSQELLRLCGAVPSHTEVDVDAHALSSMPLMRSVFSRQGAVSREDVAIQYS